MTDASYYGYSIKVASHVDVYGTIVGVTPDFFYWNFLSNPLGIEIKDLFSIDYSVKNSGLWISSEMIILDLGIGLLLLSWLNVRYKPSLNFRSGV